MKTALRIAAHVVLALLAVVIFYAGPVHRLAGKPNLGHRAVVPVRRPLRGQPAMADTVFEQAERGGVRVRVEVSNSRLAGTAS